MLSCTPYKINRMYALIYKFILYSIPDAYPKTIYLPAHRINGSLFAKSHGCTVAHSQTNFGFTVAHSQTNLGCPSHIRKLTLASPSLIRKLTLDCIRRSFAQKGPDCTIAAKAKFDTPCKLISEINLSNAVDRAILFLQITNQIARIKLLTRYVADELVRRFALAVPVHTILEPLQNR